MRNHPRSPDAELDAYNVRLDLEAWADRIQLQDTRQLIKDLTAVGFDRSAFPIIKRKA